jgi:hypothetical protein
VAREAMFAIGCIQAQSVIRSLPDRHRHAEPLLAIGLDPEQNSHRLSNYVMTLRGATC